MFNNLAYLGSFPCLHCFKRLVLGELKTKWVLERETLGTTKLIELNSIKSKDNTELVNEDRMKY